MEDAQFKKRKEEKTKKHQQQKISSKANDCVRIYGDVCVCVLSVP